MREREEGKGGKKGGEEYKGDCKRRANAASASSAGFAAYGLKRAPLSVCASAFSSACIAAAREASSESDVRFNGG